MEFRTLEFNIISAKDLKDVNIFSNMDVYAAVSLFGDPLHPQSSSTYVDKDGGTNPTWNIPAKFSVNEALLQQNRLSLTVKLISERTLAGDTVIATVHIPIKELLDNAGDGASFRQLVYQMKTASGKPKGTFNFSYKFSERVAARVTKAVPEPVMAYPLSTAAGSSSMPYGAPYPPPVAYGYPPQQYGGYQPMPPGYGYPPAQAGYGYPPQAGYGYPQQPGYGYQQAQKPKKNKFLMGLGAGLLGGALGGMLIGDMVSDAAAYDAGYDADFDDGAFDF